MRTRLVPLVFLVCSMTSLAESTDFAGVYRLAIQNDPQIGAAEAAFLARSEIVPQARAGFYPASLFRAAIRKRLGPTQGCPKPSRPARVSRRNQCRRV